MEEEIESGGLANRLNQIEILLEQYENKIGLGKINVKLPDLSIDRETIQVMSKEEIDLLRWEYGNYALFLQKEINKHNSRFLWADTNLKRLLERESSNYVGWKWEERQANCLAENIYAQKLDKLKLNSKMIIERTSFLTNKIHFLCEIARDISMSKRKEYGSSNN